MILLGTVMGVGILSCMVPNPTGVTQVIDQVQYQWYCDRGPQNPFQFEFQTVPCFGGTFCEVTAGATYWNSNGPTTWGCRMVMNSRCQAYAHPKAD